MRWRRRLLQSAVEELGLDDAAAVGPEHLALEGVAVAQQPLLVDAAVAVAVDAEHRPLVGLLLVARRRGLVGEAQDVRAVRRVRQHVVELHLALAVAVGGEPGLQVGADLVGRRDRGDRRLRGDGHRRHVRLRLGHRDDGRGVHDHRRVVRGGVDEVRDAHAAAHQETQRAHERDTTKGLVLHGDNSLPSGLPGVVDARRRVTVVAVGVATVVAVGRGGVIPATGASPRARLFALVVLAQLGEEQRVVEARVRAVVVVMHLHRR